MSLPVHRLAPLALAAVLAACGTAPTAPVAARKAAGATRVQREAFDLRGTFTVSFRGLAGGYHTLALIAPVDMQLMQHAADGNVTGMRLAYSPLHSPMTCPLV